MQLQGDRCRLRVVVDGVLGGTHIKHQWLVFFFLGTWGSLLQDASLQAEDIGVPLAFAVDWQPGWREVCFEYLRLSLGFGMAWVLPEAGAETHTTLVLNHELAMLKSLTVGGLGMWRERLQLMNDWETSVTSGWQQC